MKRSFIALILSAMLLIPVFAAADDENSSDDFIDAGFCLMFPQNIRRVVKVVNGKKYRFIEASWSPEPNVQKKRHFAVHKYGVKKALALALAERKTGLAEMAKR